MGDETRGEVTRSSIADIADPVSRPGMWCSGSRSGDIPGHDASVLDRSIGLLPDVRRETRRFAFGILEARHFGIPEARDEVDRATVGVPDEERRTMDLGGNVATPQVTTQQMGGIVCRALEHLSK